MANIQVHCRLRSHSCADTQGDTPCRIYSWLPPAAPCKNNKEKALNAGLPHFKQLHVKWNSWSLFRGQKLKCKHVETQCLTEICKDKQMWVNVPFQLQWSSSIFTGVLNSKVLRSYLVLESPKLFQCLEMVTVWKQTLKELKLEHRELMFKLFVCLKQGTLHFRA